MVREPWQDNLKTKLYKSIHAELALLVAQGRWDEYLHHYSPISSVDPHQVFVFWAADENCKTLAEYQRRWNLFIRRRQKEWERYSKDAEPVRGQHIVDSNLTALFRFDLKVTSELLASVETAAK